MNDNRSAHSIRYLAGAAGAALSITLGGCVSYTQGELARMSTVDICELEFMQRPNLTPAARQTLQAELSRRNENCGKHAGEVQQRYADFMHQETYEKQSP